MKTLPLAAITFLFLAPAVFTVRADSALETSMKMIADASHQVGADLKQTDDTKHAKDTDLKNVGIMKTEATKDRDYVPKKVKAMPDDQKTAQIADYQKDMDAFVADIDILNQDITADKWDAARTDFKKLMDDEHMGHEKFRVQKKPFQTTTPAAPAPPAPSPTPAPAAD